MDDKQLTKYNPQWVAKYGHPFKGWDDPRPTGKCLHCKGTGKADEYNECGFCYPDDKEVEVTDIIDRLVWEETNTLDLRLADLCDAARREIERLRAEVDAWRRDAHGG